MNNVVKKFIEENIELIEQNDWYKLFDQWYLYYRQPTDLADFTCLQEAINILADAELLEFSDTVEVREQYIKERIRDFIQEKRLLSEDTVGVSHIYPYLDSKLLLSSSVIRQLFKEVCAELKLTPVDNTCTRFKL